MKSVSSIDDRRTLNERQKTLVDLLAHGLTMEQAGKRLGVSLKYVRGAIRDPLFKSELAIMRDTLRLSAQPEAVHKIIETMRTMGEGGTGDRRLQFDAAKSILGEDGKAPTVNVQVNNQMNADFRPGYVIRLPSSRDGAS